MKYTQIREDTFQNLQMNAGILCSSFDPDTGEASNLLGATSGGINFTDTLSFVDLGEDIDNCPKNTKELKVLDSHEVKISGTFVAADASLSKLLMAAADLSGNKLTPRNDLVAGDFTDIWFIGDYSDVNTGADAGFIAIKLINALSTTGFALQTTDKAKGTFAFEFTGHYSINEQDTVPYEVYIKSGATTTGNVTIDKHNVTIVEDEEITLHATTVPAGQTITWTTGNGSVASVTSGVVKGEGAGNTIITATITVNGVTYTDTCTVIVTAATET